MNTKLKDRKENVYPKNIEVILRQYVMYQLRKERDSIA
jgi:hypothetical protein